jgi:hypothetical protein
MGNPDNKSDTQEASFESKVNAVVNEMTFDNTTNTWKLPEGLTEEVKFAATAEKRRRDTQASYTKQTQIIKAQEAEKAELLKIVTGTVKLELTDAQKEELEDLKFSDPETWRQKVNVYEREALAKHKETVDSTLKQVSTSSQEKAEKERREIALKEFLLENPKIKLDDDVIANDIPPRILKKLETGIITFEAFLDECKTYLETGKVIAQTEKTMEQPNLSKIAGSSTPDKNAVKEDIVLSYAKETY